MVVFFSFYIIWCIIVFLVFLFFYYFDKKCQSCHKHSAYCIKSTLLESKEEQKVVTKETIKKDKNGNTYKEIVKQTVPYEKNVYENVYICKSCGDIFTVLSENRHSVVSNYDRYKKKKKNYLIAMSILIAISIIFCIIPLIINAILS